MTPSRSKRKAKFKVGEIVGFRGSRMIFVRITSIMEEGSNQHISFYRNGIKITCDPEILRKLTSKERGE